MNAYAINERCKCFIVSNSLGKENRRSNGGIDFIVRKQGGMASSSQHKKAEGSSVCNRRHQLPLPLPPPQQSHRRTNYVRVTTDGENRPVSITVGVVTYSTEYYVAEDGGRSYLESPKSALT